MAPGQKPEAGLSVGGLSCMVGLFVCNVSRSLAESLLVSGPHVCLDCQCPRPRSESRGFYSSLERSPMMSNVVVVVFQIESQVPARQGLPH